MHPHSKRRQGQIRRDDTPPSSTREAIPIPRPSAPPRPSLPVDAAIMLDTDLLGQPSRRAHGALGQVHDAAPLPAGAPLPGVGHAIPLSFRRAGGSYRFIATGEGDGGGGDVAEEDGEYGDPCVLAERVGY